MAVLSLCLGAASPALATGISVQGETGTYDFTWEEFPDADTGITAWVATDGEGNLIFPGIASWGGEAEGFTLTGLSGSLKEDPFVTSVVSLVNLFNAPQTFTITVSLPIASFNYNATVASSVGVTVTDTDGNGVSAVSVSPDGIYTGTVNGSPVLTLFGHPTSVSCATAGCSATLPDNTGLPLQAAGPGSATAIGITLKFTLSAFDQVGITSRFEIVPEPSALTLLALGAAALALARRRAS